jgi:hypothetical protein
MKDTICQLTRLSQQMLVINPFVVVPPPLARAGLHPLLVLNVPAGVGALSPAAPDKTLVISVENAPPMLALVLSTKMTISSRNIASLSFALISTLAEELVEA